MKRLRYSCINAKSKNVLDFIIRNSVEITPLTFIRNVHKIDFELLKRNLGYTKSSGVSIDKDPYVFFFKSKLPDKRPVYYMQHSAIEYIFY